MGGPAAAEALAHAKRSARALQKAAVTAQGVAKTEKNRVKIAKANYLKAKALSDSEAKDFFRNGYDELLAKIDADIEKLDKSLFGKKAKKARKNSHKSLGKRKWQVVIERSSVDNSEAQKQARKQALKEVEETVQDNAAFGSISERHLKQGEAAHDEVDRVRENFFDMQGELIHKHLIRPEHRFVE